MIPFTFKKMHRLKKKKCRHKIITPPDDCTTMTLLLRLRDMNVRLYFGTFSCEYKIKCCSSSSSSSIAITQKGVGNTFLSPVIQLV